MVPKDENRTTSVSVQLKKDFEVSVSTQNVFEIAQKELESWLAVLEKKLAVLDSMDCVDRSTNLAEIMNYVECGGSKRLDELKMKASIETVKLNNMEIKNKVDIIEQRYTKMLNMIQSLQHDLKLRQDNIDKFLKDVED